MNKANIKYIGIRPSKVTTQYLLGGGYRQFNYLLKRFNTQDSMSPFSVGGVHGYSYCFNNPVNYIDPTGHVIWEILVALFQRLLRKQPKYELLINETVEQIVQDSTAVTTQELATTSNTSIATTLTVKEQTDYKSLVEHINMLDAKGNSLTEEQRIDLNILHDIDKHVKLIQDANRVLYKIATSPELKEQGLAEQYHTINRARESLDYLTEQSLRELKIKYGRNIVKYRKYFHNTAVHNLFFENI